MLTKINPIQLAASGHSFIDPSYSFSGGRNRHGFARLNWDVPTGGTGVVNQGNLAATTQAAPGQQPATGANGVATTQAATNTPPPGLTSDQVASMTQGILGAIGPTMQAAIATAIAPISQQTQSLAARVEQLAQPQGNIQQLLNAGQAPAIRQGENPLSSRGFQYQRLIGFHQGFGGFEAEHCKHELEFSRDLEACYRQAGFVKSGMTDVRGHASTIVPLSTRMIPDEFKQGLRAKYGDVGAFVHQGISGADMARARHLAQSVGMSANRVNQTLSVFDDAAMGIFTEAGPHGELIDLIRNRSVLDKVGVTNLTLPPNGFLPFPKQTGASTGYWVGENQSITGSQPTTGRMELRAKKAAALVTTPNELLQFASVDTEAFIRADLAAVLALLEDTAGLSGAGTSTQPRGILNHSGIVTHTRTVTVGTHGNQFEPSTPGGMLADVEELNYDPEQDGWAWIMRAAMWENIGRRRTAPHTAGTYDGEWLFPVNRDDMTKGRPSMLAGHKVVRSAQVSNTRSKGSSSDLTYVLGGIWKHFLMGRIGVMEFAMSTQGDTVFSNYQTALRAIEFVDCGLRYENAFVLCDTIDMDLPTV